MADGRETTKSFSKFINQVISLVTLASTPYRLFFDIHNKLFFSRNLVDDDSVLCLRGLKGKKRKDGKECQEVRVKNNRDKFLI